MNSPFVSFQNSLQTKRAYEIFEKAEAELSISERNWLNRVIGTILRGKSTRGRKNAPEHEAALRLVAQQEMRGARPPSYGELAKRFFTGSVPNGSCDRQRVLQALKRQRKSINLPRPPKY
jgi:hypothetical protein